MVGTKTAYVDRGIDLFTFARCLGKRTCFAGKVPWTPPRYRMRASVATNRIDVGNESVGGLVPRAPRTIPDIAKIENVEGIIGAATVG
jgi:hypothetical protein